MRVRDPFAGGTLRIDPKRKIVWSVGTNGKDDGGQIGRGWDNAAPDLGFPDGDGSWPFIPARGAPSVFGGPRPGAL